jgi:5-methylcytosine-specific restriction endonuclease McrA
MAVANSGRQRGARAASASADDVKLLVWARDGGACVSCRSKVALHFDHVIPVSSREGRRKLSREHSDSLCSCNMKKSDKISG